MVSNFRQVFAIDTRKTTWTQKFDMVSFFDFLDLGLGIDWKMDTHAPTFNSNAPSLVGVPFWACHVITIERGWKWCSSRAPPYGGHGYACQFTCTSLWGTKMSYFELISRNMQKKPHLGSVFMPFGMLQNPNPRGTEGYTPVRNPNKKRLRG